MDINEKVFDKIFSISRLYLNGKDIFPIIRRVLDPLLSITIASNLFERYYFKYEWFDVTNYKAILSFLVKGGFIIPLAFFVVIHFFVYFCISIFFSNTNEQISKLIQRKVFQFGLTDEDKLDLYKYLRVFKEGKAGNELFKMMRKTKDDVGSAVCFIIKTIVISIFYFFYLSNFGSILFTFLLLTLIVTLFITWICFLIFDIIPSAVAKFTNECEEILRRLEVKAKE